MFIDEWSPDVLGNTWALRTVDGQWSVCMVTPRAPEEEQTDAQDGEELLFIISVLP